MWYPICVEDADCGGRGSCGGGGACACESARYGGVLCEIDCGEHGVGKPDGSCEPKNFPGSRLLTPEWGGTLNGWAGKGEGQEWSLCCSTFGGCDTAAKFHAACDAHTPTLTVAHNAGGTQTGDHCDGGYNKDCKTNPGNFTFGGFVRAFHPLAGCDLSLRVLAISVPSFVLAWGSLEPPR